MITRRVKAIVAWAVAIVVVLLLGTGLWYVLTVV
jgi:uncharacterized protein HemX